MKWFRSLPIRIRLTLGFVAVLATVLAATGVFIYERTQSDLDGRIEGELAADLASAVAIVRDDGDDLGDPAQDPLGRVDLVGFVQVVGPDDVVAGASTVRLNDTPLLRGEELVAATTSEGGIDVDNELLGGPYRLAVERSQDDGVRYFVVVGASLQERNETLSRLARLLLIGGPIVLLLTSLAAYRALTAALRPVDEMRIRAGEITESDPGQRLPVPASKDEIAMLGITLNEMLGRLESAIDHERRFVADASHELRTPLSILQTEVDLALSGERSREELRAALSSVGDEVDRLVRLAEDLLVIARADQGRLPIRRETLDPGAVARRVAGRKEDPVAVQSPKDLKISGDPLRLEQALGNMLDNADRYGGGAERIEIIETGAAVEFHVLDAGPGFAPEVRERAFQRFAQADGNRAGAGAGLGLAIVEAIARAHGGTAGLADRDGGGADVSIQLPKASEVASDPL